MDQDILISRTEQGFVASSVSSPYFCFVADTQEAVLETVRKALAFYESAHANADAEDRMIVTKPVSLTTLVPGRRVKARELMVA